MSHEECHKSDDDELTTSSSKLVVDPHQITFPFCLYRLLETAEGDPTIGSIISWLPTGRGFEVHNKPRFVSEIIPLHFKQSKYKSFQRQLNLYKFERIRNSPYKGTSNRGCVSCWFFVLVLNLSIQLTFVPCSFSFLLEYRFSIFLVYMLQGAYHHPKFVRGQIESCYYVRRSSLPGTSLVGSVNSEVDEERKEDTPNTIPTALVHSREDEEVEFMMTSQTLTLTSTTLPPSPPLPPTCTGSRSRSKQTDHQDSSVVFPPGTPPSFPFTLYRLLETAEHDESLASIISWIPDGHGFKVHVKVEFERRIIPLYFHQTKYKSFQRQLNLYNFERITVGPNKGTNEKTTNEK